MKTSAIKIIDTVINKKRPGNGRAFFACDLLVSLRCCAYHSLLLRYGLMVFVVQRFSSFDLLGRSPGHNLELHLSHLVLMVSRLEIQQLFALEF